MANRTDTQADTVHGTNPQYLVDKIIRNKIYNDAYWKEFCFGLTTESLIDRAAEIDYVGGTYGGRRRPTKFLCLFLKMLQIQPDEDVVLEYIKQPDLKYLRALGAAYYRISSRHINVYQTLEPLFADYRKLRYRDMAGKLSIIHMDEFIDWLFREKTVCDITMPGVPKREILEATLDLPEKQSVLEDDLEDLDDLEDQAVDPEPAEGASADPEGASAPASREGAASPSPPAAPASRSPSASAKAVRRSKSRSARRSTRSRSAASASKPRRKKRKERRSRSASASRSASPSRERAKAKARRGERDAAREKKEAKRRNEERAEKEAAREKEEAEAKREKTEKKDKKDKKQKLSKDKGDHGGEEKREGKKQKKDKDGLSVQEWNDIRKEMGLKPLK